MTNNKLKEAVGKKAATLVEDGMTLGLGTGTTVHYTIEEIGRIVKKNKWEVFCVATSLETEQKARALGLGIVNINEIEDIDLALDGADEVDKYLNLIKGGGGALTREKIVDYLAKKFVVIVDERKMKDILGEFAVPVEVLPFAWFQTKKGLETIGASVSMRMLADKQAFVTDNNNYILDAKFSHIMKPERLEDLINNIPGVVENGLFRKDKVDEVWVGYSSGEVRKLPGNVVV